MGLTRRELALRRNSVGASESAALCGESPWAGPMHIYVRKVMQIDAIENVATRTGHYFEAGVAAEYADLRGVKLRKSRRRVHPKHRWMSATPDYHVDDDGLAEIKTVGPTTADHWDDRYHDARGVPDYYVIQAQHQMEVVPGVRYVDLVAKFLVSRQLRIFRIDRDEQVGASLRDVCGAFWHDHVIPKVPPPLDDSDATRVYLREKYPIAHVDWRSVGEEARVWMERYEEASRALKRAERDKELAKHELIDIIGDAQGVRAQFGHATWKYPKRGKRRDGALADHLLDTFVTDPQERARIVEQFTGQPQRTFRCTYKG